MAGSSLVEKSTVVPLRNCAQNARRPFAKLRAKRALREIDGEQPALLARLCDVWRAEKRPSTRASRPVGWGEGIGSVCRVLEHACRAGRVARPQNLCGEAR
jgi:hypothetical protein